MISSDPLGFEHRAAVLEAWLGARGEIARLEAAAADLLAARMTILDRDVVEAPMHRDAIWRSMVAEFSAAGHLSTGAAESAFTDAVVLRDDLPAVRDAFGAGRVTAGHVREIVRASA